MNRIENHSSKYTAFIEHQTKEQCKRLVTEKYQVSNFFTLKQTIHKMKDLVNGSILNENCNDLIVDQKNGYSNGVSNGDR